MLKRSVLIVLALLLALLTVVLGVMLFLAGLLGEMVARSAPERNTYNIKEEL